MADTIFCLRDINLPKKEIGRKNTAEIWKCRNFWCGLSYPGIGTEFRPSKILSEFSHKPGPKFYDFYPDKLVPQAKILKFYPGSAHTLRWLSGGPIISPWCICRYYLKLQLSSLTSILSRTGRWALLSLESRNVIPRLVHLTFGQGFSAVYIYFLNKAISE